MGVCNCSMFCCALLCVHSGNAIVLVGGGRAGCFAWFVFLVSVVVGRLFLAVPLGCLRFVVVVFPDHTRLLFLGYFIKV